MTERDAAPELTPLDPEHEEALISALAAAWRPAELDARRLEQIVQVALEDPLAAPTDEEIVESERLRRALEGEGTHPEAALANALRVATRSADATAVERAIARAGQTPKVPKSGRGGASGGNVVYAVFGGAAAVLALAAAIALWVMPSGGRETVQAAAPAASAVPGSGLALSRSTAPLFPERFETAATTARIDRISAVRTRELRENRYNRWGVP